MDFFMPTRLFCGEGCLAQHAEMLASLGRSCIVVTSAHAAKASGALDDVCQVLDAATIRYVVWDGVTQNPPVAACAEAGRVAAEADLRFVVGVGGGSPLDAAKAVAVFAANPTLDEAGFYAKAWKHEPLPIVLVGTTAGTGSEVTKVSVLTDAAGRKHSIHDDRLYAALAFGDSRFTHTCSLPVTLSCGVDVLAHATESYFSRKADEVSRAFAVRAVRLATGPLASASAGEQLTADQRRALYEASILGGLAINTTGTCFPHNVGYYLTETHGVPHGFASAVFLPAMLEEVAAFDAAYAAAFYSEVAMTFETYVGLIRSCLPDMGVRMSAAEIEAALPRWRDNGSVKNTRANVTTSAIGKILAETFA